MREISEITWKSFAPAYGQAHPVVQKGMDHHQLELLSGVMNGDEEETHPSLA